MTTMVRRPLGSQTTKLERHTEIRRGYISSPNIPMVRCVPSDAVDSSQDVDRFYVMNFDGNGCRRGFVTDKPLEVGQIL